MRLIFIVALLLTGCAINLHHLNVEINHVDRLDPEPKYIVYIGGLMSKYVPNDLISLFVQTWNNHNNLRRCVTSDRINCGWCYQFAMVLRKLHGERAELWRDNGHAWVKIGNKFYDAYNPRGVEHYLDLRITSKEGLRPNLSEQEFVMSWERGGGSGPIQFHVVEDVVRTYRILMDIGA